MGIQGLLPFLKQIHQPVNISDFKGCTVAVDAYCWLHKGAFSCAEKLAMGEKTEQYVYYCMKYVDNLLRKGLKPILVFDGCRLKSKEDVENTRRARRELNRKKAAQFLREGKRQEAKECLQKCVDITPQMALNLMNVCQDRGVDCIVAPYEADAQLAYLSQSGVAQLVVTEDSDLLLFGCEKVIFKMDFYGNGVLIEKSRLNEVLAIQNSFYSFEKFRYMCILSGCDYLSSLPGIGLVKACKVLKIARQQDLRQLLKKLPTYLKMNLAVTDEYVEKFICADNTFLYQLAFDPLLRKLVPLNPYPPEVDPSQLDYAGQYLPEEQAYQIALGNVDIHTHKHIAFFDPRTFKPKTEEKPQYRHQLSIWDPQYRIKTSGSPCKTIQAKASGDCQLASSHGKTRTVRVDLPRLNSVKPLHITDPGKISPDAEKLLISQYMTTEQRQGDGDESDALSQKENFFETRETMHDEQLDNENIIEKDEDQKVKVSPRKANKRKTPSWLEETAIEESVEVHIDASAHCEQPETSPIPDKGRNVFAVSPAKKMGRFNLEVHALRVKSRYFGNSSTNPDKMKSPTPVPNSKITSPSSASSSKTCHPNKKTCSQTPKSRLLTMFENAPTKPKPENSELGEQSTMCQPTKKSCLTSPKHRLLSMFERTPIKQKTEKDESGVFTRKETPKAGLLKCFEEKVADGKIIPSNIDRESNIVKIETSPGSRSSNHLTKNSKTLPQTSMKSRLSAFSWSKSGPLTRHLVPQASLAHTRTANISRSVETEPELSSGKELSSQDNSSDCEEISLDRDSEQSADSGIMESEDCVQTQPVENLEISLSDVQNKSNHKKRLPGVCREKSLSRERGSSERTDKDMERSLLTDSDTGDDVLELKSYSYSEFLKCLGDSDGTKHSSQSSIPAVSQVDAVRESETVTSGQDTTTSCSQRSSVGSIDSFCLDKTTPYSQRSSVSSIDSFLDSSQNVVDLTDPDIDSQDSQKSEVSKGSKLSQVSGSASRSKGCRISGLSRLSRTKVKPGVKRSANQRPAGQRSITDMISKYW